MNKTAWFVQVLVVTLSFVGCGGDDGSMSDDPGSMNVGDGSTRAQIVGASLPDGTVASFVTGELPVPEGSLSVTVPSQSVAINGGSTTIVITASAEITTIYVAVDGAEGHWQIDVTDGSTVEDILLTLAQELPPNLPVVVEVEDAEGNISEPATIDTAITQVGTGDVQVSVSWTVENDVDLHVVDPNGLEIYFANRTSPEGGELDLDSNAACFIDGVKNENIVWPTGSAPAGTYTVRVDNFENCAGMANDYVVTVQLAGSEPQIFMGSFAAGDLGDFGGAGDGVEITQFSYP